MKNKLLIGLLVVFIMTTLVSGSLAVYQASIDDIDGSFAATKFVIDSSAEGQLYNGSLKIAPGDTLSSTFIIKNYDASNNITETDMKLDISVVFDGGLDPVTMKLYYGDSLLGTCTGDGTITYDSVTAVLPANVATDAVYTLVFEWPENTSGVDDTAFQGKPATFAISVTGTQVVGTTVTDEQ